ncbi:hypothetical protein WJX72_005374 [[Myrmecia] bisecta]|uniref:C2 domain-containing protein n=1 Tax=[Myrmecia] bisecta TaxID=41462 RepID=A0AAW1PNE3_9CHLO
MAGGRQAVHYPPELYWDLIHHKKHSTKSIKKEASELSARLSPAIPAAHSPQGAQGEDACNTTNNNLHRMVGCNLFVQVLRARGVRVADLNGLSDPYCIVKVAGHKLQTRTIEKTLNPAWNEMFSFDREDLDLSLLADNPIIAFEVWDSDGFTADDFLGKAEVDLSTAEIPMSAAEPTWIRLREHRQTNETFDLGQIEVAAWLERPGDVTRLNSGSLSEGRTKLCTLVTPQGVAKHLPTVVHSAGNVLYEAPCVAFLKLHLGEVRDIESLHRKTLPHSPSPPRTSPFARTSAPRNKKRNALRASLGLPPVGRVSVLPDRDSIRDTIDDAPASLLASSSMGRRSGSLDGASMSDMENDDGYDWDPFSKWKDADARQQERDAMDFDIHDLRSDTPSPPGSPGALSGNSALAVGHDGGRGREARRSLDSSDDEYTSSPPRLRTISEDLDDDGEAESPRRQKEHVYLKVTMGRQEHLSRMTTLHGGVGRWEQDLMFALAIPMKDRPIKLELFNTPNRTTRGRLVAHAFIPLSDLLPYDPADVGSPASLSTPEEAAWFRLHGEHRRGGSDSSRDAAIWLTLTAVDSDTRRHTYKQPWMGPSFHASASPAQRTPSQQLPPASSASPSAASAHSFSAEAVSPTGDSASSVLSRELRSQSVSSSQELRLQLSKQLAPTTPSREGSGGPSSPGQPDQPSPAGMWHRLSTTANGVRQLLSLPTGRGADGKSKLPSTARPIGVVKLVLGRVDLPNAVNSFVVLKCGPHWGRSLTIPSSAKPVWDWEVHLPIYDPSTLLLLTVFSEPTKTRRPVKRMLQQNTTMLGKLRLRLSTLKPSVDHEAVLPLLPQRSSKAEGKCFVHVHIKVDFWNTLSMLRSYVKPALPRDVYRHGMHHAPAQRLLETESRRITLRWLENSNPPIPKLVATAVLDTERNHFTMSRARANWRRLKIMREKIGRFSNWLDRVKRWEYPWESVSVMGALCTLCFAPHIAISVALLVLVVFSLSHLRRTSGEPLPMEDDPEDHDENDNEVVASGGSGPYNTLKAKYDKLQRVALAVQNLLDDLASNLERVHAVVTATDPSATLLFVFVFGLLALLIGHVGFPPVLAVGLCWQVRPPVLRTPTPPPPISFFKRLPSKADQIS